MNVTRNAIWLLGCRVSGDLLNLAFFVVISRAFGPPGVGAYSYGFAVTGFVLVIGAMGIEEYGLREYSRMEPQRRTAFIAELLGAQATTTLMALAGVAVYLLLTRPTPAILQIMASLSLYQVAQAIAAVLFIPAMGEQRMMGRAVSDLACRAVSVLFAGLAIYVWHMPISLALIGYVPAGLVLVWLSARSARHYSGPLRISLSIRNLKRTAGVLWSFAIVDVLAQLFAKVGVIVLSLHIGETATGLYATGLRMIEAGLVPTAFVGIAVYPQLSRLFRQDPQRFQLIGSNFLQFVGFSGALLTWGLYFVAPALLVPVLGHKYAGAEPVIMAMAALALLQALELGMGRVLFAADRQVVRAMGVTIGAITAMTLNLLLVPRYGVGGAIGATVISYLLINALYLANLRRPMKGSQMLAPVLICVVALALACAAAWSFRGHVLVQALTSAAVFLIVAGGGFWGTRRRLVLPATALGPDSTTGMP